MQAWDVNYKYEIRRESGVKKAWVRNQIHELVIEILNYMLNEKMRFKNIFTSQVKIKTD